ncbi:MAG TPA: spore germination protein [Candidatus Limiplasma stercoravium]|nr:spore germination protein [Candidatus Limiplasma stercoravium]
MQARFHRALKRNMEWLDEQLGLSYNDDVITREFSALGHDCAMYYVDGMANGADMAHHILKPLLRATEELSGRQALEALLRRYLQAPEVAACDDPAQALSGLMRGQTLVLMDTVDAAVMVDLRGFVRRPVTVPQTESVVVGPHEAFNESLRDNLTLLHRLLPTPKLAVRMCEVGTSFPTQAALCYLRGVCKPSTVDELERRLQNAALDHVLTLGVLSQLIEDDPFAPLPQSASTERPDRAASFLLEGQALILLDGTPYCLAMPMGFWHLFHAPDDSYMRWQQGTFMRLVRMAGALLCLILPGLFVSLVVFQPITMPMSLLTNIIQSRSVVSISLFAEALLMLAVFNLINEAGTRIPGLMGSSFGLVSALILGTAAVDAGLVSPLLIIVVALSGLGSYALPNYPLSLSFRIGQLIMLLAGGFLGIPGLCLGLTFLIMRVAGMESLGEPYLAPASPRRVHNPDLLLRAPLFRQRLRAYLAQPEAMLRARGRMRRGGGDAP